MIEKFIESEANAKFKRWKKLARDARAVRKERATLMEGIHLMQVALESGCRVNAVLIDADRATREARELALELCRKSGADLFALSPALYDQLSPVEHGVGVMCEAAVPPAPADDAWKSADALYLDGVQDAGNAGTLIRTAVAAGVRVVAASPVAATLWSPKVMRAGMGALRRRLHREHHARGLPQGLSRPHLRGRRPRRRGSLPRGGRRCRGPRLLADGRRGTRRLRCGP